MFCVLIISISEFALLEFELYNRCLVVSICKHQVHKHALWICCLKVEAVRDDFSQSVTDKARNSERTEQDHRQARTNTQTQIKAVDCLLHVLVAKPNNYFAKQLLWQLGCSFDKSVKPPEAKPDKALPVPVEIPDFLMGHPSHDLVMAALKLEPTPLEPRPCFCCLLRAVSLLSLFSLSFRPLHVALYRAFVHFHRFCVFFCPLDLLTLPFPLCLLLMSTLIVFLA